jgi:hypothetical protein
LDCEEADGTYRFLDIALICENKGDFKMAAQAAAKACQVKRDCQGSDFPDYSKYVDVVYRVQMKLVQQQR